MKDTGRQLTGLLAIATGAVSAGSAALLATYFRVGDPFGEINDTGNALTGVLSAALAWRLRHRIRGRISDLAVGGAALGGALTVVGSWLVMSQETGFFLSGLVSSLGFAGIGAWLLALNRSDPAMPRGLRSLGIATGALMALGVVMAPGILLGYDDMGTAPAWIWVGQLGWLGTYVAYPAWAIWFGVVEVRRSRVSARVA